jgi:hypothetical protein
VVLLVPLSGIEPESERSTLNGVSLALPLSYRGYLLTEPSWPDSNRLHRCYPLFGAGSDRDSSNHQRRSKPALTGVLWHEGRSKVTSPFNRSHLLASPAAQLLWASCPGLPKCYRWFPLPWLCADDLHPVRVSPTYRAGGCRGVFLPVSVELLWVHSKLLVGAVSTTLVKIY